MKDIQDNDVLEEIEEPHCDVTTETVSELLKISNDLIRSTYDLHRDQYLRNNPKALTIDRKLNLTVHEAAEYSNIGITRIDEMLRRPNCPFVLYVGTKKLVKRREFEEFLSGSLVI